MPWLWLRRLFRRHDVSVSRAREQLASHSADLRQRFFLAASTSGKPRGLRWKTIEWETGLELAREKRTGHLAALAGVTIAFEAVEGGDMEGVAAVGNLRNATAVFFHHTGTWQTTGKVIFNLDPGEVLERFASQYERVTDQQ